MFRNSKLRLCDKKQKKIFRFLPLINSSVTIGLSFFIISISAIILSNAINIFCLYFNCFFQYFYKYQPRYLSIQEKLQNP